MFLFLAGIAVGIGLIKAWENKTKIVEYIKNIKKLNE